MHRFVGKKDGQDREIIKIDGDHQSFGSTKNKRDVI